VKIISWYADTVEETVFFRDAWKTVKHHSGWNIEFDPETFNTCIIAKHFYKRL
jgi:hypothetical protein